MDRLLTYTKKSKEIPYFIKNKEVFLNLFDRVTSRTHYIADHFNFKSKSESIAELLAIPFENLSWSDCCCKRAIDLLKLNKENYFLSYSGGIDSTAVMVAILQTWPENELKKISLVITSHSIDENPSFFANYLTRFPLINFMAGTEFMTKSPSSIFVTGDLGDQLFGSLIMETALHKFGESIFKKNYKDYCAQIISNWAELNFGNAKSGVSTFEYFHPIVSECPYEIKTVGDFFWWFDFSQKWQHVKFKYLEAKNSNLHLVYNDKITHFYDTIYFQHWSMNNPDKKIKDTWKSYKFINKEFIYSFTKDKFHLEMLKYPSVGNTYFFTENRIAIDKNYNEVESLEELKKYLRVK